MHMKRANVVLLITALALTFGVGCKKNPKSVTAIPGSNPEVADNQNTMPMRDTDRTGQVPLPTTGGSVGLPKDYSLEMPSSRPPGVEDRLTLSTQTVYFDFDSAAIKQAERGKLDEVATYMKANAAVNLKIEGHCDERGTDQYNLSLGERRAQAARNYLVHAGIDSDRITTVSFGKEKPAQTGTDEAAYAKNRRDEFVVLQAR